MCTYLSAFEALSSRTDCQHSSERLCILSQHFYNSYSIQSVGLWPIFLPGYSINLLARGFGNRRRL